MFNININVTKTIDNAEIMSYNHFNKSNKGGYMDGNTS